MSRRRAHTTGHPPILPDLACRHNAGDHEDHRPGLPASGGHHARVVEHPLRRPGRRRTTLATRLAHLKGPDVVVVGLPRGGIPVADEVARALDAPLDVLVVRKLGLPVQPELAMGAIGEGGVCVVDQQLLADAGVTPDELRVRRGA